MIPVKVMDAAPRFKVGEPISERNPLPVLGEFSTKSLDDTLSRKAIYANRRLAHIMTALGDSRVDAVYLDGPQRNRNSRSALNNANNLMGHRLTIGATFGKSGDRTDHLFARLAAAIATGAGAIHLWCGINNIAAVANAGPYTYVHAVTREIVTIANVAAVTFRDLRDLANAALAAGMIVILENEIGGNGINTVEKVIALNDLRQMIFEFGDATPGVFVHDAFAAVMQAGTTVPTFKPGYSYDGTHENSRGGYRHGKSLVATLAAAIPARASILSRGMTDVPANGRRQLLVNHLFLTASGGAVAAGVTGNVPGSFTTNIANGTATITSGANADGVGNYIQVAIDFTGKGDFRLTQALNGAAAAYNALLSVGDKLECFSEVEIVNSPTNLASVSAELTCSDGTTTTTGMDQASPSDPTANDMGIDEPCVLTLRSRAVTVQPRAAAYPYVTAAIRIRAMAAGSIVVRIRQLGLRRKI